MTTPNQGAALAARHSGSIGSVCSFATTSSRIRGLRAPTSDSSATLAAAHPNDRVAYTNGKTAFIQEVTAKAKATHANVA